MTALKTRRAVARKVLTQAERQILEHEYEVDHLDVIAELGLTLKQPIPKGDDFLEWIADEEQLRVVIAALLSRHFSWEEIRTGLFDLTRWRWLPSVEQLQLTYGGRVTPSIPDGEPTPLNPRNQAGAGGSAHIPDTGADPIP
jgi:hypothetical protein